MRLLAATVFCLLSSVVGANALAHGGGLDRCGGHHDRKRGGYHVHRQYQYCRCYPDAEVCRRATEPPPEKSKSSKKKRKNKSD
jgi:hypothetical protein